MYLNIISTCNHIKFEKLYISFFILSLGISNPDTIFSNFIPHRTEDVKVDSYTQVVSDLLNTV